MRRIILWPSAAAVAAVSCLAVLVFLREPPAPDPAAARDQSTPVGVISAAPAHPTESAPAAPAAPDAARRLRDAAQAAQAQEQALRDAIFGIAEDTSLALDARLDRYREAVRTAQAEDPAARLAHPGIWTEAFLRAEAVQQELAALGPAARSREIAHIRRELGYDEEEIAHLEESDARREARWQNGLEYMQERERITATFEGDVLAQELNELRETYFAQEAPTIEREERDGFFRFERPRVYGRN